MNKHEKPYHIEYTFHVQSAEDFYRQLHNRADEIVKSYDLTDDTTLAKTMLESIGVRCA